MNEWSYFCCACLLPFYPKEGGNLSRGKGLREELGAQTGTHMQSRRKWKKGSCPLLPPISPKKTSLKRRKCYENKKRSRYTRRKRRERTEVKEFKKIGNTVYFSVSFSVLFTLLQLTFFYFFLFIFIFSCRNQQQQQQKWTIMSPARITHKTTMPSLYNRTAMNQRTDKAPLLLAVKSGNSMTLR